MSEKSFFFKKSFFSFLFFCDLRRILLRIRNPMKPLFLLHIKLSQVWKHIRRYRINVNPKQAGGGDGIHPQDGSSLCCAETVSSRKLKLSDFYYILIGLNSEYKPVPWDIHCCHGNIIVEWCSVKFWLKSVKNCIFCSNRFLISV